jgi:hypothetical protein
MANDQDFLKATSSIISGIEDQLRDILSKKKEAVERDLEEKINLQKREAQSRMAQIERELAEEREALDSYKEILSNFEVDKDKIKREVKGHLDKAIEYQSEIKSLTAKTLRELEKVSELDQKLLIINHDATEKIAILKKDLEEKFGVVAKIPEIDDIASINFNLEAELQKLNKIRELLGVEAKPMDESEAEDFLAGLSIGSDKKEEKKEAPINDRVLEGIKEQFSTDDFFKKFEEKRAVVEESPRETRTQDTSFMQAKQETEPVRETEAPPEEEVEDKFDKMLQPEILEFSPDRSSIASREVAKEEKTTSIEADESDISEFLDKYRKTEKMEENDDLTFFEKDGKIILDGESIVMGLNSKVEEAKKLYSRLMEIESPKEQFFLKQDIIRRQDALRKLLLSGIRISEKDTGSLPEYTSKILNIDVLKTILERVSMENWSNQEDFKSFELYIKELNDAYYNKITPQEKYLEALFEELKAV